jgi:hypothetical protein
MLPANWEQNMSEGYRPLGFRNMLLEILRASTRRKNMNAVARFTPQSLTYRRKAAALARLAEAEQDELKMLPIVHQALSWIQLAENEELLSPGQSGSA